MGTQEKNSAQKGFPTDACIGKLAHTLPPNDLVELFGGSASGTWRVHGLMVIYFTDHR